MDKGQGGGKTLIHKMWIICFFLNHSLSFFYFLFFLLNFGFSHIFNIDMAQCQFYLISFYLKMLDFMWSQFDLFSFVTVLVFKFSHLDLLVGHNLHKILHKFSCWLLSQFRFLIFFVEIYTFLFEKYGKFCIFVFFILFFCWNSLVTRVKGEISFVSWRKKIRIKISFGAKIRKSFICKKKKVF